MFYIGLTLNSYALEREREVGSTPELSSESAQHQDGPTFYSSWVTAPRCAGTSDVQCLPAVRVAALWPTVCDVTGILTFLPSACGLCTRMCWSGVPLLPPCGIRSAHSCNSSRCSASRSTRSHLEKQHFNILSVTYSENRIHCFYCKSQRSLPVF